MASILRRHLLRNTLWNYIGFAVNLAVNVVLFPLAIARMGDASTGVWLLIGSVSGYMGLLQLGLTPAMAQFAAAHIARRDDEKLGQTVSTAMALVLGLGSIALLALPLVPWMLDWFSVPAPLRDAARTAFILGIVGVPLQMPGHVFNAVLGASQRQDKSTHVWMVSLSGKLVGIAVLLQMGFGLEAVMWLETALIIVADVLLGLFAFGVAPQLRLAARLVTRPDALQLLQLGGWMFASALSTLLIEQTDRIVIGAFLSVVAVTQYSAAWKLYMLAYSVCTTLVQAVWPAAAALHANGDIAGIQRLWLRMTRYSVAVAWPMAWSLALCASPLLSLWVGSAFAEHYPVVQLLVGYFIITAHNHVAFGVLAAMRLVGPIVKRYSVPQAVLNLVLSLWFIHPWGITGVALGTLLPVVFLEYAFLAYVLRSIELTWGDVWRGVVRPTAVPAGLAFAPSVAIYATIGPHSPWLLATAAISSAAFGVLFWRGLGMTERQDLIQSLPAPVRARLTA